MKDFTEPQNVFQLLSDLPCLWGIAGGWAVDLFLDRVTRKHQDVEVALFREDQLILQQYLSYGGWSLYYVKNGELYPWRTDERLELPIHEIWGRHSDGDIRQLEVLLNERTSGEFRFRRNPGIKLPVEKTFVRTKAGIPILAPEIVLLYKSKHPFEPKDQSDFSKLLGVLTPEKRHWLLEGITAMEPRHAWVRVLKAGR
jgi:hypothetical protein